MYRQHLALRDAGVDSHIFCEKKNSQSEFVTQFQPNTSFSSRAKRKIRKFKIERELDAATKGRPDGLELFSHDRTQYADAILSQIPDADVYNLHWINWFVDLPEVLEKLCQRAPVYWSLHDQNPLTGGCHYTNGCERCYDSCGQCPQLGSPASHDLSSQIFSRRKEIWDRILSGRLHFIALCDWMKNFVEAHPAGKKFGVSLIPNSIPTEIYQPWDLKTARGVFGFPEEKQILLFVAHDINNKRKGFDLLQKALERLPPDENRLLVAVGMNLPESFQSNIELRQLGYIQDESTLSLMYRAADLFIIPSREDNLPNTVLESMSCGTPVVGLPAGGIPEMVQHGKTGWISKEKTAQSLAETILEALSDQEKLAAFGENARQLVLENYHPQKQAARFKDVFQKANL